MSTGQALHAEWTKLRTLPSTWWLLLGIVGLTVAAGAMIVSTLPTGPCTGPGSGAGPGPGGCVEDTVRMSLRGVWLGQAAVAVFAALAVTAEYGTGTITPTLLAMPGRVRMLAAKAVVVSGAALAAGLLAVIGTLLAGRALIPDGRPPLPLTDGPTLRAAFGSVLFLALIALVSLGLATVLRDTAGAVTACLALLYALPILASVIPDPAWQRRLLRYGLTSAGTAGQATRDLDLLPIAPWPGLAVAAAYAIAALLLAATVLRSRDAS
jgi:ABC-2 type transport system permease protein